jgi:transposase-like protein
MFVPVELSHPAYTQEDEARQFIEAILWPEGAYCPFCGTSDHVKALGGQSMGPGWYHCGECRKKFTVRVGTVFERSHIPLNKWLLGFRLYAGSKKGFSAHQLHRTLKITYRSAWFMAHRIREAMRDDKPGPLGGKDQVIEADETFIGPPVWIYDNARGWLQSNTVAHKRKVMTLVERGGRARSFHVESLKADDVRKVLLQNASTESRLHTDEAHYYRKAGREFAKHERVNHSAMEYARGDVTSNTVEGFFSIFKRGMKGVYHHCGEQHLQRYLHEFDFRYSNRSAMGIEDAERTTRAIKGASGKRLTYRRTNRQTAA